MKIFKSFIGWICFLSLVAAPIAVFLWLWALAWPFLHGATVTRLQDPAWEEMHRVIGQRGIDSSLNPMLESFVKRQTEPRYILTGFAAAADAFAGVNAWFYTSNRTPAKGMNSVSIAFVQDRNGKVIAAYPKALIGLVNPASLPLPFMKRFVPQARFTVQRTIRDKNEAYLGQFYVYSNGDLIKEDITLAQRTPSWLVDISGYTPDRNISATLERAIIFLILFLILLPIWVGMDASWRGMRPFVWGILVFLTSFIGLLAYLIARLPAPRLCSNCGEKVFGKYLRCPACGVDFLQRCPNCGRKMKPGWQFCPLCKTPGEEADDKPFPIDDAPTVVALPGKKPGIGLLDVIAIDADTGLPLRGVSITAHGPSELSGLTNGHGAFTMHRLVDGEYCIDISKSGYSSEKRSIQVSKAHNEKLSVSLKPMPGKVIGRAADCATGKAISGAKVYLDTSRIDRTVITSADGAYILDNLPQGDYPLVIENAGYETLTRLVKVCPGQSVVADIGLVKIEEEMTANVEGEKTDVIS